jgi:undecaprenyl-phosphate 4-deoxy-4-formamido-L-arabinose transferase
MTDEPALSIVVPVHNGHATIGLLVEEVSAINVDGGLEVVLVDDGSTDGSPAVCEELTCTASVPVTLVAHARNYGEHNALMTGLRHARGDYIVTMDDDLQNPPDEVKRLYEYCRDGDFDVVYTRFAEKSHAAWRNLGSWFANRTADLVLDKPKGLYLSTFRCMKHFVAKEVCRYKGPFPYIDGLIFQVTGNVGSLTVEHLPRAENKSRYSLSRLVRLWLVIMVNFSVVPLRLSTFLGLVMSGFGFTGIMWVLFEYLFLGIEVVGWPSLMLVMLLFSGLQLLILGLAGEYLGRIYLTVNARPQAVVRKVVRPKKSSKTQTP